MHYMSISIIHVKGVHCLCTFSDSTWIKFLTIFHKLLGQRSVVHYMSISIIDVKQRCPLSLHLFRLYIDKISDDIPQTGGESAQSQR